MTAGTLVRWGVAAIAFTAIGLASMRFGHEVGFGLLLAALLAVFALDVAAKRAEKAELQAAGDDRTDPEGS